MALWRVLDLNERAATRRGQAPAIASKQNEKRTAQSETKRRAEKGRRRWTAWRIALFYSALRAFIFTLQAARLHLFFFAVCFVLHCAIGGENRSKCPLLWKSCDIFPKPRYFCPFSWLISEGVLFLKENFPKTYLVLPSKTTYYERLL